MEQYKIYWVGPRKSDIANVRDIEFYGSVTIFGDGKDNNYAYCLNEGQRRVNHNVSDKAEDQFFYDTIVSLIEKDKNSRFYFYNPQAVYFIDGLKEYKDYFLAVNDEPIMMEAVNKEAFYENLRAVVPQVLKMELNRNNCDYSDLVRKFGCGADDGKKFIFQAPVSSGGNGTFIVEKDHIQEVKNLLSQNERDRYLVSVYREQNVPINIHAVIFADRILLTQGSIQIMKQDDHRLLYRGADFRAYRQLDPATIEIFREKVIEVCKYYQAKGYRGVCGIDGIVCKEGADGKDTVYILEINNRFQASTGLVDLALAEQGCPSLQAVNLAAFEDRWEDRFASVETAAVDYSSFFYTDNGTTFHSSYVYDVCKEVLGKEGGLVYALEDDGYRRDQQNDALGYLFRVIFRTNITSINPEGGIWINENICEPDKKRWYDVLCPEINSCEKVFASSVKAIRDYLLTLKISLLTQGVRIEEDAQRRIVEHGGLRPATNNAIDLRIDIPSGIFAGNAAKYLVVNAPVDIRFIEFSPFRIVLLPESAGGKHYCITYYGKHLIDIGDPYPLDPVALVWDRDKDGNIVIRDNYTKRTDKKPSIPYSEVGFLSTDRLRVHLTNKCIFKRKDENGVYQGCAFCNIEPTTGVIDLANIEEVVQDYCDRSKEIGLTHFLIGGQTAPDDDQNKVIDIIQIIRRHALFAPIYAMTIPYSEQTIRNMYDAGLDQISFNVEVFDDETARKYMPGKRSMPCSLYLSRLRYATRLFGRKGNVRTMIIVGLERRDDVSADGTERKGMLSHLREFAAAGIQPILSVFRPLPETPLEDMQAPPMLYLKDIYERVLAICRENSFYPGPDCVNCQNNTLALPRWLEEACGSN